MDVELNPGPDSSTQHYKRRCTYRGKRGRRKAKENEALKVFNISPPSQLHAFANLHFIVSLIYSNLVYIPLDSPPPNFGPPRRFALWNAHSVKTKTSSLCDLVLSHRLDVLSITETWLSGNDHFMLADLMNTLQDYSNYNLPRPTCRGGGVAVVARKGLAVKQNQTTVFSSFEHLDLVVTSRNKSFCLLTIYRPPPSKKNKLTPEKFFSEFSILLADLIASPHQLLLSGDFNFHVDDTRNLNAMKFLDLITSADLRQHVNGPTHHLGHTLDLLITRSDDKLISQARTLPELVSDDNVVVCDINLPRPPASRLTVSYP